MLTNNPLKIKTSSNILMEIYIYTWSVGVILRVNSFENTKIVESSDNIE